MKYMDILKENLRKIAEKLNLLSSLTFNMTTTRNIRPLLYICSLHTMFRKSYGLHNIPIDLNPIVHLWEELITRVIKRAITKWQSIGPDIINSYKTQLATKY